MEKMDKKDAKDSKQKVTKPAEAQRQDPKQAVMRTLLMEDESCRENDSLMQNTILPNFLVDPSIEMSRDSRLLSLRDKYSQREEEQAPQVNFMPMPQRDKESHPYR